MLPFVDDFAVFQDSFDKAVKLREFVFSTLHNLGLEIHPTKGYHIPVQLGDHLGMQIDLKQGMFRAPPEKLSAIATLAKTLLFKASANKR